MWIGEKWNRRFEENFLLCFLHIFSADMCGLYTMYFFNEERFYFCSFIQLNLLPLLLLHKINAVASYLMLECTYFSLSVPISLIINYNINYMNY